MAINRDKINKSIEKNIRAGRLENAIADYLTLLKENPKDWNVRNQLGDLYSRIGKVREAVLHWTEMAEYYALDGLFPKAIAVYTKIRRIDPNNMSVVVKLAELNAKQGLVSEARGQYLQVAELYQRQNKITDAIEIYKKLVELDRDNVKTRIKLAEILAKERMLSEAVEEFTRAAEDLRRQGKAEESLQVLNQALDLDRGNTKALLTLARTQVDCGKRDSAIRLVEEAIESSPHDPTLLKFLGALYQKEENFAKAEFYFKRLVEVDPGETQHLLMVGEVFLKRNELDRTFSLYEPVVDILIRQREAEKAVSLMRSILNIAPAHVRTLRKLVDIYQTLNKRSNLVAALSSLADALNAQGDTKDALGVLQKLIDLDPENYQHRERLVKYKGEKGEPAVGDMELPAAAAPAMRPIPGAEHRQRLQSQMIEDAADAVPAEETRTPSMHPPVPPEALECLTEADVFMRYKLLDKAHEQVLRAIKLDPRNLRAHLILKEISEEKGLVAEAVRECITISEIHEERGETRSAREVLAEAAQLDPNTPALLDRIRALESGQRKKQAEAPPQRAVAAPEPPRPAPPEEIEEPVVEAIQIDLTGLDEAAEEKITVEDMETVSPPPDAASEEAVTIEPVPAGDVEDQGIPLEVSDIDLDFATFDEGEAAPAARVAPEHTPEIVVPPPLPPQPPPLPPTPRPQPEISTRSVVKKPPAPPAKVALPGIQIPVPGVHARRVIEEEEIPELRDLREAVASFDLSSVSTPKAAKPPAAAAPPAPPKPAPPPKPTTLDELLLEDIPELEAIVRKVGKPAPKKVPPARVVEEEAPADLISSLDEIELIEETGAPSSQQPGWAALPGTMAPGLDEALLGEGPPPLGEEPIALDEEPVTLDIDEKVDITAVTGPAREEEAAGQPVAESKDAFFDLSSELEAELLKAETVRVGDGGDEEIITDESQSYQEKSLEELFTEFRKGIDKQLGEEDYDTRYNLGIAYKEMGLIDEAIGEFQIAAKDPPRLLECCSLLGLCFMEKGMSQKAVHWLRMGIEAPGHREEEYQGLRYDLGLAYQQVGDYEKAIEAFKDVFGFNARYRSVADRIKETEALLAKGRRS